MRFFRTILVLLFGILVFTPKIQAQDTGWAISAFTSNINVHQDGSVVVEETISVDFHNLAKHGIFRTILVDYRDRFGNRVNIRLDLDRVTDGNGQDIPYKISRRGNSVEIKIGDPNQTVSGFQTYILKSRVERVITNFRDHSELYWNVTGNNWPVPIRSAVSIVSLPKTAIDATCFTGPYGSNLKQCSVGSLGETVDFWTNTELSPGEGLTIVTAIPKGAVQTPSLSTRIWWLVSDNWPYAIPFLIVMLLLWFYWQQGRDERYKSLFDPSLGTERVPLFSDELIPSTYAPLKDLKPAEAGVLIDEEANIRDIAATIVDLAVQGYLRIEEVSEGKLLQRKKYRFVWLRQDLQGLDDFESQLLIALFGKSKTGDTILLSELKYKFAAHLGKIRDSLYEQMVKQGYFLRRPDKVVATYRGVGIAVIILGFWAVAISLAWMVALVSSGFLIFIFAKAMPRRTALGRKEYLRVLGLRNFISLGAYREQLWEKANLFEEVLPFAIALNLTHKVAEAFAKVSVPEPKWYKGSRPFAVNSFAYAMEDFTRQTTTTLPTTKSASSGGSGFGGGGFSGGGFGGGGGGSW